MFTWQPTYSPYADQQQFVQTSGSAQGMAAELLRAEMQSWEEVYKPVELSLLNQSSLNNPDVVGQAVNRATATTGQVYDRLAGEEKRTLAGFGITPTAEQAKTADRVRNLSRASALADARNQARANIASQDEQIAIGTAPNPNIVQGSANAKYRTGA